MLIMKLKVLSLFLEKWQPWDGPKLDGFLKYKGEQTMYKMCFFTMSYISQNQLKVNWQY